MPDRIVEIIIDKLKTMNYTVELKEKVHNNKLKAVYNIESDKDGRFFGLIKMKIKFNAEIDPETGDITEIKKPWWAFLVTGEDGDQLIDAKKVTLCHIPPGDPENKQTITIGAPAVRAHLAHGDHLGECAPSDEQNNTGQNNTNRDLALSIISPQNIIYNMTNITVEINSTNANLILYSINGAANETYSVPIVKTFMNGTNTLDAFALNSTINKTIVDRVSFNVILELGQNNTENNQTNSTN